MSRSPSPSVHFLPPRSDTGSPFDLKSGPSHIDVALESDASSPSTNSTRDLTPSDSEMSDSDDDHSENVKLPSIREFWSGRLPSDGSCLDSSLRDLGIEKPLPPRMPASAGHGKSRGCPFPLESLSRAEALREVRVLSSPPPTFSPAIFTRESPIDVDEWRPVRPPSASKWSNAPSGSRSGSPYHDGAYYRTISRPRYQSVDSDSEDGYCARSEQSHSQASYESRRLSQFSHRSPSFDSDLDLPVSRRSSLRSLPPNDQGPSRRYHYSTSFSDHGSAADAYRMVEHRLATDSSWETYVEKAGRLNGAGPIMYTCRWRKHEGETCNYTGKKQLAKRHVESVHLGKKPHVCPECRKPFPQKTSLDIHIRSVHTFDKPLKCEHCTACFSDPARRHKHYRVEHPDKVVKKPRVKIDYKDIEHLLVK